MSIKTHFISMLLVCVGLIDLSAYAQQKRTIPNRGLDQDLCLEVNDGGSATDAVCIDGDTAEVRVPAKIGIKSSAAVLGGALHIGNDGISQTQSFGLMVSESFKSYAATFENNALPSTDSVTSISNGSPAVITYTGHNLVDGQRIHLSTDGALPTGLSLLTSYYASIIDDDSFNVYLIMNSGSLVNTSSAGSGTHSVTRFADGVWVDARSNSDQNEIFKVTANSNSASNQLLTIKGNGDIFFGQGTNTMMGPDPDTTTGSTLYVRDTGNTAITTSHFGNGGGGAASFIIDNHAVSASRPVIRLFSRTDSDGNYYIRFHTDDADNVQGYIKGDTSTTVVFASASDRRIKHNINAATPMLKKINSLNIVNFDIKEEHGGFVGEDNIGVIAQELQKVFPNKVTATDSGEGDTLPDGIEPWDISREFTFEMLKAIQELSEINQRLNARIEVLEFKN